ncbi:MAG: hypothetical protein JWO84_656, partial [Parcubacteria group bacterium]|nr:hypothetical protein [Parcubacteria group bacterium]
NDPYVLCIMTQGSNFAQLEAILKDLSAKTYQGVQALTPK